MSSSARILDATGLRWRPAGRDGSFIVDVPVEEATSLQNVSLKLPETLAEEWIDQVMCDPLNGLGRHSRSVEEEVIWLIGDLLHEALVAGISPPQSVRLRRLKNGKLSLLRNERPQAAPLPSADTFAWHTEAPGEPG